MRWIKKLLRPVYIPLVINWKRYLLRRKNNLKIMTPLQTARYIRKHHSSMCRFGDGEFALLFNESDIGFQKNSVELIRGLKDVFERNHPNVLICVPRCLVSTAGLKRPFPANYWANWALEKDHYKKIASYLNNTVGTEYHFGDAMITRPYMDWRYRIHAKRVFAAVKKLWKDRDVLIVEGEQTRLGIGNDIFADAQSIRRILAPAKDAFQFYDELIATIHEHYNGALVLIALGPTATLLSCALSDLNIQALDVGHVDIEYMWYQMKATSKVAIPGKYTNEAADGHAYSVCEDKVYNEQIIARIGCNKSNYPGS